MDKGKISIVVPVYMVEAYLDRCIQSLTTQTYGNIEILLVDDESPDGCPQLCDEYGGKDSRIKVMHINHQGVSGARNAGIVESTGDYIMYVDPDDYIESDSCEKLIATMDDEVDIVCGAIRQICGNRIKYMRHTNLISGKKYKAKEFVIRSIRKNEWHASVSLNLCRKKFLTDNSLFYKIGRYYEDFQILPRLFLSAESVVYVDYPFYSYCLRPGSTITSGFTAEKRRMFFENCEDWMHLIETVDDEEYKKALYGQLIRTYLAFARRMKTRGWNVRGMDYAFAKRYALDTLERIKVFVYNYFPLLYRTITVMLKGR